MKWSPVKHMLIAQVMTHIKARSSKTVINIVEHHIVIKQQTNKHGIGDDPHQGTLLSKTVINIKTSSSSYKHAVV